MTDPEQGAGAPDHLPEAPAEWPGWRPIQAITDPPVDALKLSPDHPDFPSEWGARITYEDRVVLDGSPLVQETATRLEVLLAEQIYPYMEALHAEGAEAKARNDLDRATYQERHWKLRESLLQALLEAARSLDQIHGDIPLWTRQKYLAEITNFPEIHEQITDPTSEPISIIVNRDPKRGLLSMVLPGETQIKFSRMATRSMVKVAGEFVTEAQAMLGHDKRRRRNRPKKDTISDDAASIALAVAKLYHWHTRWPQEIGWLLGWLKPGDSWDDPQTRKRVTKRVERAVKAGTPLLKQLYGPHWRDGPPEEGDWEGR